MKSSKSLVMTASLIFSLVLILGGTALTPVVQAREVSADSENSVYTKVTYSYKSVGDHDILADVYYGEGQELRPTVVWIHGGGLIFGTRKWMPEEQLKRYVNAGWVVVAIDHRLVPETKIPEIIEDLKDAYAWVRYSGPELFKVDPDRIAVVGHSSGGYLALMAGVVLEPRPKALIAVYGFGDLTGDWTVLPNSHFTREPPVSRDLAYSVVGEQTISSGPSQYQHNGRPLFFRYTKQQGNWTVIATGHDPKKTPDWFAPFEPIRNITPDYPPTLLIHGAKDTDVPLRQSLKMAEALKSNGVEHDIITHPEWEHLFDLNNPHDPEVQSAFDTMTRFLANQFAAGEGKD